MYFIHCVSLQIQELPTEKKETPQTTASSLKLRKTASDAQEPVNYRKNRRAPKPPTKSLDEAIDVTSNLEIRAPSELLLGVPSGLRAQWRHTPEALVNGFVKYEVNVSNHTIRRCLIRSIMRISIAVLGINRGQGTPRHGIYTKVNTKIEERRTTMRQHYRIQ